MTIGLGEAIQTAIEFEKKVQKMYADAARNIADPVGEKVFKQLAVEESGHLAYLKNRLDEWRENGRINVVELSTVVPNRERIEEGRKRMAQSMRTKGAAPQEIEYLKQAFEAEKETSSFYKRMVAELPDEGKNLFARFVAIEEGHVAIVQAEIDSVQGMGFWFDMMEFDLEAG